MAKESKEFVSQQHCFWEIKVFDLQIHACFYVVEQSTTTQYENFCPWNNIENMGKNHVLDMGHSSEVWLLRHVWRGYYLLSKKLASLSLFAICLITAFVPSFRHYSGRFFFHAWETYSNSSSHLFRCCVSSFSNTDIQMFSVLCIIFELLQITKKRTSFVTFVFLLLWLHL